MAEIWAEAAAYEPYVGRWSRLVAGELLAWLAPRSGLRWLDVGCGTGALSHTILERTLPGQVVAVDRSPAYVAAARSRAHGPGLFVVADAQDLPVRARRFDHAVSALVLNFVAEPGRMIAEMERAVRPGGRVALYVWDYAGRMDLMRHFWDAAATLSPRAGEMDEGTRFPICRPEALEAAFAAAGLSQIEARALDVPTVFRDFDDFWQPFLGGQGPAPGYARSLSEEARAQLRELLHSRLPRAADGSIPLVARAWAVRGVVAA
jgi:SAM-dependent methyltransferase